MASGWISNGSRFCLPGVCVLYLWAALAAAQEDLALQSQRAKQAMEQGRFEEAVRLYSNLVRAVPRNPGLIMNFGLALHSAGRYEAAIEQFTTALSFDPTLTPAKILIGVDYQKLGQPAKAVGPLAAAVRADPSNRVALLELADAHLALGQFAQAAGYFRKLTQLDLARPKAWQGLGLSYLGLSRRAFETLEKTAPDSPYVLVLLARSRGDQQQYRSAFALYRQSLAADPGLRGVHAALAEIYRQTGHDDWARVEEARERQLPPPECLKPSLECDFLAGRHERVIATAKDSSQPAALHWISQSYAQLALTAFAQLSELAPSAEGHELQGDAYSIRHLHHKAAEEYRRALSLDPANRRLEMALATSLWRDRDYQAAQPMLEKLASSGPPSAQLHFELGDCLLEQDETEKALPWLERAVNLDPKLLPARAALGRAYLRSGQAADAIEHLNAALPADEDGSFHFQLARAYERSGNPEQARRAREDFEAISQAGALKRQLLEQEQQITPP